RTPGNVEQEVLTSTVGVGMRHEIGVRASQHPHICALQTGSRSSIPACHNDLCHAPSKHVTHSPLMDRTPSKPKAALWMTGWLSLMLIVAIAGREATRELNVFQIMELRSGLGLLMLYPLIRLSG